MKGLLRNRLIMSFPRKRKSGESIKSTLLDCPVKPDNDKKSFRNSPMKYREISAGEIEKAIEKLCIKANTSLRPDIVKALKKAFREEMPDTISKRMLKLLIDNAKLAEAEKIAICQDTGMVVVFVEMGRRVVVKERKLSSIINSGVEKAYKKGHFRKSIVADPVTRGNTDTNTPAVMHLDIADGDKMTISVMIKGFGSENKSRVTMLNPTSGTGKIIDFCVETVKIAGPDACPPYILGIGLGGTMDSCAFLSKKALLRPIGRKNPKKYIAEMERKIENRVNALKIGVMGLGGKVTVMGVNIEESPTHIAGLPVAVNLSCHALRTASIII